MHLTRSVLWYSAALPAMERCDLFEGARSQRLEGTVLTLFTGSPAEIRYTVVCNARRETLRCTVHLQAADSASTIRLDASARGSWPLNGRPAAELEGVADVDLGFSPSTNTLPIRRLALEVGATTRVAVAWLRFPELDVVRAEQSYTRRSERVYEFSTGDFSADLEVDEVGLVTRYGDLWRELTTPST